MCTPAKPARSIPRHAVQQEAPQTAKRSRLRAAKLAGSWWLLGRSARAPPWARAASASASCLETGATAGQARPAVRAAATAAAELPAASAGAAHAGVAAPCGPSGRRSEPQKHRDAWLGGPTLLTLPQAPSPLIHAAAAAAWVEHRGSWAATGAVPAADGLDNLAVTLLPIHRELPWGRACSHNLEHCPFPPASLVAVCHLQGALPVSQRPSVCRQGLSQQQHAVGPPMSHISGSLLQLTQVCQVVRVS